MTTAAKWLTGILAVLVAAAIAGGLLFARMASQIQLIAKRVRSIDNLHSLAQYLLHEGYGSSKPWPATGKRLVLWPVGSRAIDPRRSADLELFFSLGDASRSVAKAGGAAAFEALTTAKLRSGTEVDAFTSYAGMAGTDADAKAGSPSDTPLLADLSFADVAIVAFADGRVKTLTRAELGLAPGDPLVAGPTSKSPLLQRLSDR